MIKNPNDFNDELIIHYTAFINDDSVIIVTPINNLTAFKFTIKKGFLLNDYLFSIHDNDEEIYTAPIYSIPSKNTKDIWRKLEIQMNEMIKDHGTTVIFDGI